ncbi:MAG: metal-dependent hydrolase [Victivallaceae bacterium]
MHIQTHFLAGWCVGNLFPLNGRERLLCALAAILPDFDGLGIILGQEIYWKFHHVLGHNLLFSLLLTAVLVYFSEHKLMMSWLCFGLMQLHMVMDLLGSGELWTLSYLWPFSNKEFNSGSFGIPWSWALYSWQNLLAGALLIIWTVLIIRYKRRTPLEIIMPNLDRKLVDSFNKREKT